MTHDDCLIVRLWPKASALEAYERRKVPAFVRIPPPMCVRGSMLETLHLPGTRTHALRQNGTQSPAAQEPSGTARPALASHLGTLPSRRDA